MEDRNWYIAGIAVPSPPMSGRHGYRQDSLMSEPWLVGGSFEELQRRRRGDQEGDSFASHRASELAEESVCASLRPQ